MLLFSLFSCLAYKKKKDNVIFLLVTRTTYKDLCQLKVKIKNKMSVFEWVLVPHRKLKDEGDNGLISI